MASLYIPSTVNIKIVLLRNLLKDVSLFDEANPLLLQVHAWLHAREMAQVEPWSFQEKRWE